MTNKLGSPHQISSGPGANSLASPHSLASPNSLASLKAALEAQGHVAESSVLSTLRLALQLKKPLLLDGPSGSGKSHFGKPHGADLDARLWRENRAR